MSLPKLLFFAALLLFATIGVIALFKGKSAETAPLPVVELPAGPKVVDRPAAPKTARMEIVLQPAAEPVKVEEKPLLKPEKPVKKVEEPVKAPQEAQTPVMAPQDDSELLPEVDRTAELFNLHGAKFAFIETVTYRSRVQWLKGRPAWLSDYANYYSTSRHFIARSLNGTPDYFKQDVLEGDKFNVYKKDKEIEFYLLLDTTRCKMWLYAIDKGAGEKTLVKSYRVGLGRLDSGKTSGLLTPHGKYSLGNKIAIYKPKTMGHHGGQKVEMIKVFGTRWIPFENELTDRCTASAKGFGLHGVPWGASSKGELVEELGSIGKYESDGCVRLSSKDIEEIFAIVITKPTTIELVRDYKESELLKGGL